MTKQVIWTKEVLETFIREANLTDTEEKVIRTRAAGMSRTQQCIKLDIDMSTLDRTIKVLRIKYDIVQKRNPDVLPKRTKSAKELYLDTH